MSEKDLIQLPINTRLNFETVSYCITGTLGNGQFGKVYKALDLQNKEEVAIKTINLRILRQHQKVKELFESEIQIMQKIKNSNVVKFVNYHQAKDVGYLVLELCNGGDLDNYIKTKPIDQKKAIIFFQQIINGMSALHEKNIMHRDLKLPNIFVHNETLKIGDLGFAKQLKQEQEIARTILGTPLTMAPEVLQNQPYTLSADIYSLGVIFYQILFKGKYPFNGSNQTQLIQNINKQQIDFNINGVHITEDLKNLLRRMLKNIPSQRITWVELCSNPIFLKQEEEEQSGVINFADLGKSIFQSVSRRNQETYKNIEKKEKNNGYNPIFDQNKPALFDPSSPEKINQQKNQYQQKQEKIIEEVEEIDQSLIEVYGISNLSRQEQKEYIEQQKRAEQEYFQKIQQDEQQRQKQEEMKRREQELLLQQQLQQQQEYERRQLEEARKLSLQQQAQQQQQQQQYQQQQIGMIYKAPVQLQQQQQIFQQNQAHNNYNNNYNNNNPWQQEQNKYDDQIVLIDDIEIKEVMRMGVKEKEEVQKVIGQYLNELNILKQILNVVRQAHELPETQINTYYPVYFLLKKLMIQINRLQRQVQKQENIFGCSCPKKLFSSDEYINMQNMLEDMIEIANAHFIVSQIDIQDLMSKTPNPDIMEQLNDQENPKFPLLYKQIILNYVSNLSDEVVNKQFNQLHRDAFLNHLVDVSDCICFETTFKSQPLFDFQTHLTNKKKMNQQQKQTYVESKVYYSLHNQL